MFSSSLTKQTWFWRRQLCRNSVHAVKDWLVTILTSQRSQQQRRHQDSVAFSRYLKLVFCFFRYLFLIFKNLQKFIFSKSKHFAKSFEPVGKEPRLVLYSQTKGVKRGYIYRLFHTKDLEDYKDNVHLQSLSGIQQCLWHVTLTAFSALGLASVSYKFLFS